VTALPMKDSSQLSRVAIGRFHRDVARAQTLIYDFLLEAVRTWPPEDVLVEFRRLFIHQVNTTSSDTVPALYEIVFANQETEFRHTLKRACYILINNWEIKRQYAYITELIDLFSDDLIHKSTMSPTSRRLRQWLQDFIASDDFREIKLFAQRHDGSEPEPWSQRYTSYLLVPQYANLANPVEQREAARALSFRLREKFKFDLAFYTAHSQQSLARSAYDQQPRNPTALGDEVLRLIKFIVARRGQFNHLNLAHIFLGQTKDMSYKSFKKSLCKYLLFSVERQNAIAPVRNHLTQKLDALYPQHNRRTLDDALLLRTCNRIIEYLTTEDGQQPSSMFALLLSQGNPLMLVIILLKIILICNYSRVHLESRIATLIRYYENLSEQDCQWVLNFLEVFRITMTIHAENIEYNLVNLTASHGASTPISTAKAANDCRIFSQMKRVHEFDDDALLEHIQSLDAIADETLAGVEAASRSHPVDASSE
jgi:hypothetical protein